MAHQQCQKLRRSRRLYLRHRFFLSLIRPLSNEQSICHCFRRCTIPFHFSGIFFRLRRGFHAQFKHFLQWSCLVAHSSVRSAYVFCSYLSLYRSLFIHSGSVYSSRHSAGILLRICSPTVFSLLFSGQQSKMQRKMKKEKKNSNSI